MNAPLPTESVSQPATDMRLRLALGSDASRIASLNAQLIEDEGHVTVQPTPDLEERIAGWLSGDYTGVLFEVEGEAVGYALFRPDETGVYLRQFFVCRNCRRRGYGRLAIQALYQRFWPLGTIVTVDVLVHNQAALAFWRALGFSDYGLILRHQNERPSGT